MNAVDKEYHQFGPWLMPIEQSIDVPPQFDIYTNMILEGDYAFKVPIQAARREVREGMLLYHQVIILYPDKLISLDLGSGELVRDEIRMKDIEYVAYGGELLNGFMKFVGKHATFIVRFNAVSQDVTTHVMRRVRVLCSEADINRTMTTFKSLPLQKEPLYKYYFTKEKDVEDLVVVGYQPFYSMVEDVPVKWPKFIFRYFLNKLNDTMFMTNGTELIVAGRGREIQRNSDANYAFSHSYIRLDKIKGIELMSHPKFESLRCVDIRLGHNNVIVPVASSFDVLDFANRIKKVKRGRFLE